MNELGSVGRAPSPDRSGGRCGVGTGVRRSTAATAALVAALATGSCLDRPLCDEDCRPRTTNVFVDALTSKAVDKIDLLFMIDNSASMADKQAVLKEAVPDLVKRLVNPFCVNLEGTRGATPALPTDDCESGFSREFLPISDIHIGVITSSLGGHGGKQCSTEQDRPWGEEADDQAHLIATRPRFAGVKAKPEFSGGAPADPAGFLDWNPKKSNVSLDAFNTTFQAMTVAADEFGCGYEAQLESIYRFLSDPKPPKSIQIGQCPNGSNQCAVPVGTDDELLRERQQFLRPDSLVAVILLTDENDCSIRDSGQGYYVTTADPAHGSAACATNPNDRCCYSCGSQAPDGCTPDPACSTPRDNPTNLRCFEQQRRFGFDFLYPTARYVNALTKARLCLSRVDLAVDEENPGRCADLDGDGSPDILANPLFQGANGGPPGVRPSSNVFVAGLVGVPWQDIRATVDENGKPLDGPNQLHYKTAKQLQADGVWNVILGEQTPPDGAAPIPPTDTLMVESIEPRGGMDGESPPVPLAAPSSGANANPVNGHEWTNTNQDDLQYACTFRLPEKHPCPNPADDDVNCDCSPKFRTHGTGGPVSSADDHNPLCQDPSTGAYGTDQYFAKAYPGLRELNVLRDIGDQAIVASICAMNLDPSTRDTAQNYGYRPAVDAIVDRLKEAINGRCLPRDLKVVPDPERPGSVKVPCSVLEVRSRDAAPTCDTAHGRTNPRPAAIGPARQRLHDAGSCGTPDTPPCDAFTVCEIAEAGPDCHRGGTKAASPGWCYVDPAKNKDDDPALVANCEPSKKRILRFVDPDNATPAHDAIVLIACSGADLEDDG